MIDVATLPLAEKVALTSAASLFFVGLITGIWKYSHMARSDNATAPYYVDITHRTALMYSFACGVFALLLPISQLSAQLEFWATVIPISYFSLAVVTYAIHGALNDTDNQLRKPHKLGKASLPGFMLHSFMGGLIIGEVGGFLVIFYGVIKALWMS